MEISDTLTMQIQDIQHTANDTMTRVTLTETETVGDMEKVSTLLIEPMVPEVKING